jgi:superfamily II DNA helicase RecQ
VLDKQTPLVVILLTSRGKSLLFTLLACIKGAGVIVVIILYQALIKDLVSRICEYRVNYIE